MSCSVRVWAVAVVLASYLTPAAILSPVYAAPVVQNVAVLAKWGDDYTRRRDFKNAVACYSKAIAQQPKNTALLQRRAFAYQSAGEPEKAIIDYGKVIQLEPKNSMALANRAVLNKDRGNIDLAIQDINRAIAILPKDMSYRALRGEIFMKKEKWSDALTEFDTAMKVGAAVIPRESLMIILQNKSEALVELKRYDEAISCCDRALALNPPDFIKFIAFRKRAEAHRSKGDLKSAIDDVSRALATSFNPGKSQMQFIDGGKAVIVGSTYLERGMLYQKIGDTDKAKDNYKEALTYFGPNRVKEAIYSDKERLAAQYLNSQANFLLGNVTEAIAGFDGVIDTLLEKKWKDPEIGTLYYLRSAAHERLGHMDLADADKKRMEEVKYVPTEYYQSVVSAAVAADAGSSSSSGEESGN